MLGVPHEYTQLAFPPTAALEGSQRRAREGGPQRPDPQGRPAQPGEHMLHEQRDASSARDPAVSTKRRVGR